MQELHTAYEAFPLVDPAASSTRRLVRHFRRNPSSISFAVMTSIFLNSAVGGAERVFGERWGE